ncbi:hypothetical protein QG37_04611 [Candidozyma auris]|nr:hypothetical protein QG37_04611 [[Candida] auris]
MEHQIVVSTAPTSRNWKNRASPPRRGGVLRLRVKGCGEIGSAPASFRHDVVSHHSMYALKDHDARNCIMHSQVAQYVGIWSNFSVPCWGQTFLEM